MCKVRFSNRIQSILNKVSFINQPGVYRINTFWILLYEYVFALHISSLHWNSIHVVEIFSRGIKCPACFKMSILWLLTNRRRKEPRRLHPWCWHSFMMTSSNGNIFRVTGPLCGEFTGHRWIPCTKASDAEFDVLLIFAWINGWVNNRVAGDLRRHHAHFDVTVMNVMTADEQAVQGARAIANMMLT